MKIYIGYDPLEDAAYKVAETSARQFPNVDVEPLMEDRLRSAGLYTRMVDKRGQKYDLTSGAPCSTEFATSRFLVPLLCQTGWALFVDCDVVFLGDPTDILEFADPSKAVMVVQHDHRGEGVKMCGMKQVPYFRKNWSSVMLFNCDHPANQRLSLRDVNERPGRDLHRFYWLADDEIGSLPTGFNWLVNVQDQPETTHIAHFTEGGPWFDDWESAQNDDIWTNAAKRFGVISL